MNLDEKQVMQMSQKKVDVIAEQQERKQERKEQVIDKPEKEKKKKKKKNKGLKDFMDDDKEFAKYSKAITENTNSENLK